ncbi:MAG: hypothetical protein AAGC55_26520 [Myxococcota bacterium]
MTTIRTTNKYFGDSQTGSSALEPASLNALSTALSPSISGTSSQIVQATYNVVRCTTFSVPIRLRRPLSVHLC